MEEDLDIIANEKDSVQKYFSVTFFFFQFD